MVHPTENLQKHFFVENQKLPAGNKFQANRMYIKQNIDRLM